MKMEILLSQNSEGGWIPIEFGEKIVQFGYPKSSKLSYEGNLTSGIVSGLSDLISVSRP